MDSHVQSTPKKAILNVFISVFSKIFIFIIGLVIPRLMLTGYGSESNGLLNSVGNIFNYIALIEAGISTVALQAIYGPISRNEYNSVSEILVATRNYFRKLIKWYILAVILFAVIFPFVVYSAISNITIALVIIVQGFSSVLTFYFASTLMVLLSADGREYVGQVVALIVFVLNSTIKIILILFRANLVVLQTGYLIVNVVQILIYSLYVKKNYKWVDWNATPNYSVLGKRNKYLINGISWVVFNSTDTIVISIFCGFKVASIYAVYNLIFSNLNMILQMIYSSNYFILGQTYNNDKDMYITYHDGFESIISIFSFGFLFSAYVLSLPFITYYTRGVEDIDYYDKFLPVLFCAVQILGNSRLISGNLINVANRPELTMKASIVEVVLNISISIILTIFIGLYGVLIGTIVGLMYKTNLIIVRANRIILNRKPIKTYIILGGNILLFIVCGFFMQYVSIEMNSYIDFVLCGLIVTPISLVLFGIVNIVLNTKSLYLIKDILFRLIKRTEKEL